MVPYFCTVGKGLEKFCVLELSEKVNDVQIHESITGKVFFSSKEPPGVLLALKVVERLFILVFNGEQFLCQVPSSRALRKLKSLVESDPINWDICLNHWRAYQELSEVNVSSGVEAQFSSQFVSASCAKKLCISYVESCDDSHSITNFPARFRVSCKCSGIVRKTFHQQLLARIIGRSLVKTRAWTVDLRNPDVEVYVHASDQYLTLGLPVTKRPLSDRPFLKHIKVRSTLCHAVLMAVGGLSSGSVVLDPMCGAATLLVEGAVSFPSVTFIGLDICPAQLKRAKENVNTATVGEHVHLLLGSAVCLPLKDGCVSHVICDLPFGNKFGSVNDVKRLLPDVLLSLNRVICSGGKLAFLISNTLTNFLHNSVHNLNTFLFPNQGANCVTRSYLVCRWKALERHSVKLGELPANICVFEKESVKHD
ncbi:hypothetical protein PR048_007024 [Dryococelus australis]|uniref:Ribosomal RNA large subunit methyltransferase K/L-like methyltransferase domain-containing protein n=1 Tax=Dryococelus australis TaxID=614101 RepID=A0ABQ9ICI0_9NEOP|nr:hypothetical protein PR048_007024 [Dryococelus australis]